MTVARTEAREGIAMGVRLERGARTKAVVVGMRVELGLRVELSMRMESGV